MGYDTRPLLTMEEKARILQKIVSEEGLIFFEHDAAVELCSLTQSEKGIKVFQTLTLAEL
jgi:hypothetical protein